jgi:hypothetical protein
MILQPKNADNYRSTIPTRAICHWTSSLGTFRGALPFPTAPSGVCAIHFVRFVVNVGAVLGLSLRVRRTCVVDMMTLSITRDITIQQLS